MLFILVLLLDMYASWNCDCNMTHPQNWVFSIGSIMGSPISELPRFPMTTFLSGGCDGEQPVNLCWLLLMQIKHVTTKTKFKRGTNKPWLYILLSPEKSNDHHPKWKTMPTTVVFQCLSRPKHVSNTTKTPPWRFCWTWHFTLSLGSEHGPNSAGRIEGNFCQEIVRNVKKSNTAPPKLAVRTCQEGIPKGKKSSSNHEFPGASC